MSSTANSSRRRRNHASMSTTHSTTSSARFDVTTRRWQASIQAAVAIQATEAPRRNSIRKEATRIGDAASVCLCETSHDSQDRMEREEMDGWKEGRKKI